jgi:hypothetical protein
MPIARQRVAKHIPATTNISIARRLRSKHAFATIEEEVFSMGPRRDYISSPVVKRKSVVERERELLFQLVWDPRYIASGRTHRKH